MSVGKVAVQEAAEVGNNKVPEFEDKNIGPMKAATEEATEALTKTAM